MLAKMLKLKDHVDSEEKAFITVEKTPAVYEKLRILSRHQQSLIEMRKSGYKILSPYIGTQRRD